MSGLPFDDFRELIRSMPGPDEASVAAVRARNSQLTKPLGSLGRLVCDSVAAGVWSANDLTVVLEIAVASVALFFLVYLIMNGVCAVMGFNIRDRIACQFCGSKKSLATGVPLAPVMFGHSAAIGLIVAPIMVFHFLQLVIVSVLAARFARRVTD